MSMERYTSYFFSVIVTAFEPAPSKALPLAFISTQTSVKERHTIDTEMNAGSFEYTAIANRPKQSLLYKFQKSHASLPAFCTEQ